LSCQLILDTNCDEENVMTDAAGELPVPELDPRPITLDQFIAFTPEKLELISGYLIDEPEWPEPREQLLALLRVNSGLVEVVKRAPRERWLEALNRAYGPRTE
jgi:hypothetical protein